MSLPPPQLLDAKEQQFLKTALLNYTRCLGQGGGYDLQVIFRLVQLWLRCAPPHCAVLPAWGTSFLLLTPAKYRPTALIFCRRLGTDREVNALIGAAFRSVPSYKFLPLVYQVASRMSAGE